MDPITAAENVNTGLSIWDRCKRYLPFAVEISNPAFRVLHDKVIHSIRELGLEFCSGWQSNNQVLEGISTKGGEVCTNLCLLLSMILKRKLDNIRCCLKLIYNPTEDRNEDRVVTLAACKSMGHREVQYYPDHPGYLVSKNTVWAALLGRNDGLKDWEPYSCFSCHNMKKRYDNQEFACTRDNFWEYYLSTIVFPIRFQQNLRIPHKYIGFLAIDSDKAKAFRMPDIFKVKHRHYTVKLQNNSIFHLGAMCAA